MRESENPTLSAWSRLRRAAAFAAIVLVCGSLAAAPGTAPPAAAAPAPAAAPAGGRIIVGVRGDVTSFNIYTATNAFTQEISDLLFLHLAMEQDDFRDHPPGFRPALASSWEFSKDGRTLTFHLDPKARWSDGKPVTSSDVLFSHQAATSDAVAWVGKDVKDLISKVEAPDARTIVYRFARPSPYALMDAAEGNILPRRVYEPTPLADWPKQGFLEAPVGSGPFVLKRYERGSLIELQRNPHYLFAPRPRLDSVVFRILPDEATLVNELLAGGIDVMENVPPDAAERVAASPRLRLVRVPDLSYTFVCWNTARPLFSDARVRRALTLAIDRQAIVDGLLPGTGRVSAGPALSFLWSRDPSLQPLPHDVEASRRLLAEAGWTDSDGDGLLDRGGTPFRFTLESNQGSGLRADAAQMIAAQLRPLGIEATPRVIEFGAFVERHEKHDFDAFVGAWRESTKVDLKSAFHSASRDGGYNYGSYANPAVDAAIDQARGAADAETARPLWWRAQRLIVEDQPLTFLFERDRLHAVPRRLEGFHADPRSAYTGLEEWSLAPPGAPTP
ncbi:MAG TPA: ABC transporter substrate-binding protein [Candidatus Polarisedimenticolia bacterium]|nr:ABC transporter substrate-binding protein [Candidatus Polarisedimenticolia bacterium]